MKCEIFWYISWNEIHVLAFAGNFSRVSAIEVLIWNTLYCTQLSASPPILQYFSTTKQVMFMNSGAISILHTCTDKFASTADQIKVYTTFTWNYSACQYHIGALKGTISLPSYFERQCNFGALNFMGILPYMTVGSYERFTDLYGVCVMWWKMEIEFFNSSMYNLNKLNDTYCLLLSDQIRFKIGY